MQLVLLDFSVFETMAQVLSFLGEALDFPPYYGQNLDALYDCLTDLSSPTRLLLRHAETVLGKELLPLLHRAVEANPHLSLKAVED